MDKKKPYSFYATEKPFRIVLDTPCIVSGYSVGNRSASFYKPIPVQKGDTFKTAPGGILLNDKFLGRRARPLKKIVWRISWVASRLRIAVFQDRDRIWNRRTRKPTRKHGKPYWTACDLRSYHIGCADTVEEAVKRLFEQIHATNFSAEEERAKGYKVIRWRCLLTPKEIKEMEIKAMKTGFILDDVKTPPFPTSWQKALRKLKA